MFWSRNSKETLLVKMRFNRGVKISCSGEQHEPQVLYDLLSLNFQIMSIDLLEHLKKKIIWNWKLIRYFGRSYFQYSIFILRHKVPHQMDCPRGCFVWQIHHQIWRVVIWNPACRNRHSWPGAISRYVWKDCCNLFIILIYWVFAF